MIFLLFIVYIGISVAFEDSVFQAWKLKYNKIYHSKEEEAMRFANFVASYSRVQNKTTLFGRQKGAVFGFTKFSDLSVEEFKSTILMKNGIPRNGMESERVKRKPLLKKITSVPEVYDWRNNGAVTAVKDQGQCGSCWAFSATETIESSYMLKYNLTNASMKPLAPQQIVDCDQGWLDNGCNGGTTSGAYNYVISAGGIERESSYPYRASQGDCSFDKSLVAASLSTYHFACYPFFESQLLQSAYTFGPISVCVDASNWQDYQSGVLSASQCDFPINILDHCVQAVGWNLAASSPHWIVRNSWNTDWGEDGYIRLEYGANTCGITEQATHPSIK